MDFVKMQGLGNDFIVVAGPAEIEPGLVAVWCDRRLGIGADGVLEVSPIDDETVRMRYWNADGSVAEMCGNGLRCVARYAAERGLVSSDSFVVETAIGPLPVRLRSDGSVKAFLGEARLDSDVEVDGLTVHRVNLGNPHAVQWVGDTASAPVATIGPTVETAAVFPQGTNAEFASIAATDTIDLRVWERGVGETLACGTGAAATAYLAYRQGKVAADVTMRLLGGELLVTIDGNGVWIEGPAERVFAGTI
jgi:diaminopimelate epimerase